MNISRQAIKESGEKGSKSRAHSYNKQNVKEKNILYMTTGNIKINRK